MATNGQPENEPQVFRLRGGLMKLPLTTFLFPHLVLGVIAFTELDSRFGFKRLTQRWEFWILLTYLLLILPIGSFLIQNFYSKRNSIEFTGSSLVQTQFFKPYKIQLAPETKLAVYLYGDGSFLLREFDPEKGNLKRKEKAILLGQVQDMDLDEANRLLTTIHPHLEHTTGLSQLFASSRSRKKTFSIEKDYWESVLGELRFKGAMIVPSELGFKFLILCGIGLVVAAGATGLVIRHPAKVGEVVVYSSLLFAALSLAIGTLLRVEKLEALVGTKGVGVQSSTGGIRRALPYRLLGDLSYTVRQAKGKTVATITSKTGPEKYSAVVAIESDQDLAQLEQAIQDAQPKLGTPLAKEKRQ